MHLCWLPDVTQFISDQGLTYINAAEVSGTRTEIFTFEQWNVDSTATSGQEGICSDYITGSEKMILTRCHDGVSDLSWFASNQQANSVTLDFSTVTA